MNIYIFTAIVLAYYLYDKLKSNKKLIGFIISSPFFIILLIFNLNSLFSGLSIKSPTYLSFLNDFKIY